MPYTQAEYEQWKKDSYTTYRETKDKGRDLSQRIDRTRQDVRDFREQQHERRINDRVDDYLNKRSANPNKYRPDFTNDRTVDDYNRRKVPINDYNGQPDRYRPQLERMPDSSHNRLPDFKEPPVKTNDPLPWQGDWRDAQRENRQRYDEEFKKRSNQWDDYKKKNSNKNSPTQTDRNIRDINKPTDPRNNRYKPPQKYNNIPSPKPSSPNIQPKPTLPPSQRNRLPIPRNEPANYWDQYQKNLNRQPRRMSTPAPKQPHPDTPAPRPNRIPSGGKGIARHIPKLTKLAGKALPIAGDVADFLMNPDPTHDGTLDNAAGNRDKLQRELEDFRKHDPLNKTIPLQPPNNRKWWWTNHTGQVMKMRYLSPNNQGGNVWLEDLITGFGNVTSPDPGEDYYGAFDVVKLWVIQAWQVYDGQLNIDIRTRNVQKAYVFWSSIQLSPFPLDRKVPWWNLGETPIPEINFEIYTEPVNPANPNQPPNQFRVRPPSFNPNDFPNPQLTPPEWQWIDPANPDVVSPNWEPFPPPYPNPNNKPYPPNFPNLDSTPNDSPDYDDPDDLITTDPPSYPFPSVDRFPQRETDRNKRRPEKEKDDDCKKNPDKCMNCRFNAGIIKQIANEAVNRAIEEMAQQAQVSVFNDQNGKIEQKSLKVLATKATVDSIKQIHTDLAKIREREPIATTPEKWKTEMADNRAQTIILYRVEGETVGARYQISIPWTKAEKPNAPKYTKGNISVVYQLKDGSRLVINAENEQEGKRVLNSLKGYIKPSPATLANDAQVQVFKRSGRPVKVQKMIPVRADYYANGSESSGVVTKRWYYDNK